MHDQITHGTLFNAFRHSRFRATSCTLRFWKAGQNFGLLILISAVKNREVFWKEGNLQRLQRSFNKEVERMNIQFDGQHWQHLMEGYSQK